METPLSIADATRARIAVTSQFCAFGACFGTWAPHIPLAKARLDAGATEFGLALLSMGLGAVLSMPMVGWLINRHGSANVGRATVILSLMFLYLPFAAPTLPWFAAALLLFGAALGSLDVAMNSHGLIVENTLKKPVMSAFHGMYGVAALLAAGLAALLITHVSEPTRALVTISICGLMIAATWTLLLPASADKGKSHSSFALPSRGTLGLGLLCCLALIIEGSVVDWAGIFLRETHGASAAVTSIAFAVFAGCLAASRLLSDRLRSIWGSPLLTRWSAGLTAASLLAAVLATDAFLALACFGLAGFFIGPIAPILFAGGGRAEPDNPGRGISAVTMMGYFGSVAGPPLVGFAADATSLTVSLGLMAVLALVIAIYARLASAADGKTISTGKTP